MLKNPISCKKLGFLIYLYYICIKINNMNMFDHVLVCGDIHDNYDNIPNFIREYELKNCAVIVAGDFGIGFESMHDELGRLRNLNRRMIHTNSTTFAIRGNHDNPEYFTGKFDLDNVKLIPDYTVLNLNNINILCVGGATSVDRIKRKSFHNFRTKKEGSDVIVRNDYWPNELFVYDHDKVMSLTNINVVVTHSAPQIAYPYTKGNLDYWSTLDDNILTDCRTERSLIQLMYDNLMVNNNPLKKWYYGHFHMSNKLPYLDTDFIALNIDEIQEINI